MANRVVLAPKLANETLAYPFDFLSYFSSPTDSINVVLNTNVFVYSGIDPNPTNVFKSFTVSGSIVNLVLQNGVVGVIYEIALQVQLTSGQNPILRGYLAVIPDLP